MPYWLATKMDQQSTAHVKRFDPRFWTVNFPRPMMAGVTTTGANGLRADCVFYRTDDLAGLIWEAEDVWDHPLLAYQTSRDFRGCRFSFHWRANGMMPLDAINGPTLTIEGRDAAGQPKSWYIRLWNYQRAFPMMRSLRLILMLWKVVLPCPPMLTRYGQGILTGCSFRSFRLRLTQGPERLCLRLLKRGSK
jgi:hypothetical protein